MKKIILSMAMLAMVGATATAQETMMVWHRAVHLLRANSFKVWAVPYQRGVSYCRMVWTLPLTKTVHLIFPSAIRYVDLGSQNIIAGKAEDAENVLRVKASVKDFETETNISVICEDGSFYAST